MPMLGQVLLFGAAALQIAGAGSVAREEALPTGTVARTAEFHPGPDTRSERQGFGTADIPRLLSVGELRLSPDGRSAAYTIQGRIRIMDLATGESRPFGDPAEPASSPRWSPDGRWISYMGRAEGRAGLIVAHPDGSEARFLAAPTGTNHPLPSTGERFSWSPDSKRIAFISATPGPERTGGAEDDPVVITRYLYRTSGSDGVSYFTDNKRLHIFVAELETREVRQLTDGPYHEHSIAWSPKGDEILFVSNREPDPDRFFNYDLFTVRVSDGEVRALTRTESVTYHPSWSPDGSMIAYQGTRRGLTSSETTMEDTRVWVMRADGSERRELGGVIDNRQGAPSWAPDGRSLYFTVQERGNVALYRLPVAGGAAERIIGERGRVGSFGVGPRNSVVYTFTSPTDLAQLFVRAGGQPRQLTALNRELLAAREIAEVEAFTFTTFDGLEVEAFLTKPLGISAASKHPMIVTIHGGPHGQQGPTLDLQSQIYASRGWATLMINYRGSTGYGQRFADAIFGDQNGREAMDILQGTAAALRRYPWIDRDRLGIEGGSYGGQLTMWLITQTAQFKAAIPRAGISNLVSFNYLSYYHDYLAVEFGGFPHQGDLMDRLWQRSALRHVAQVRTPTMLVHGMNDHNVPRVESEQFYTALQDVGVEAVLVLYPRAGHGIRDNRQRVDLIERSMAWYERHFRQADARTADVTSP